MGHSRQTDRATARARRGFAASAVVSFCLHAVVIGGAVSFIRPSILLDAAATTVPYIVELQLTGEQPTLPAPIFEPTPLTEIVPQVEVEGVPMEAPPPLLATELEMQQLPPALEAPVELAAQNDLADAWALIGGELHASMQIRPRQSGAIGVGGGSARGGVGGIEGGSGTAAAASNAPISSGTSAVAVAQVAQTAAELIHSPRPSYPAISLRRGEEGSVVVRIQVAADGSVAGVELVETSGFTRLDQAALDGVRSWRFRPATRGGAPIASLFLHRLTFRLAAG